MIQSCANSVADFSGASVSVASHEWLAQDVVGKKLSDDQAMEWAFRCARLGVRGANPLVGALVLDHENMVLAVGWHKGAGSPHAEVDALLQAQARGADLAHCSIYVSLEPCNHTGRTGPCSRAIADSGIGRVVYALDDPTPEAGGGADYLRAMGIEVVGGIFAEAAYELNRRWFEAMAAGRPYITLKIASSQDGFIAAQDGSSQWITREDSRVDGHGLRARAGAIMVGTETVLADDPTLSARNVLGEDLPAQPLRVVMGLREVAPNARVRSGEFLHLATRCPQEAARELFARGVRHLLIEGGPALATAFLADHLVDELVWYRAPILLGQGRAAVGDLGIYSLGDAQCWELDQTAVGSVTVLASGDTRTVLIPSAITKN